jgi:hypothetical protein
MPVYEGGRATSRDRSTGLARSTSGRERINIKLCSSPGIRGKMVSDERPSPLAPVSPVRIDSPQTPGSETGGSMPCGEA